MYDSKNTHKITVTMSHCGKMRAIHRSATVTFQIRVDKLTERVTKNIIWVDEAALNGTVEDKSRNLKEADLECIGRTNFH